MTKILIDAYNIARPHGTGVATYGRTLARAAGELGNEISLLFGTQASHARQPLLNEIALAEGDEAIAAQGKPPGKARLALSAARGIFGTHQAREVALSGEVILPPTLRTGQADARYWNAPRLYNLAHGAFQVTGRMTRVTAGPVDVAHWTYPLPVRVPGAANIYTLHDLVPLRLPYTTADRKKSYLALCRAIARRADHILTVSEHSRADIIRILGVEEARVTNLYQPTDIAGLLTGVTEAQIAREVEGLLRAEYRGYYLFFGAIEPKKNVARLVEAFLASGSKKPLVIVGAPGWGSDRDVALLKQLTELDRRRRIRWLGYLPRQTLATVIAGARAVLFPSLYEGFGLPVLEAMALGTPVITSTASSLPEVAGEAGLLVDPTDVRALTAAILSLDGDDTALAALSQAGLMQAQRFSPAAYRYRLEAFYAAEFGHAAPRPVQEPAPGPEPRTLPSVRSPKAKAA
jgi:glycosyltransferase involved in cell wall biosynthesis